jgi:hypothetical protein
MYTPVLAASETTQGSHFPADGQTRTPWQIVDGLQTCMHKLVIYKYQDLVTSIRPVDVHAQTGDLQISRPDN